METVYREANKICVETMSNPVGDVPKFVSVVRDAIKRGYSDLVLKIDSNVPAFPNVCVPIAAAINYYSREGISFSYEIDDNTYLGACSFSNPLVLSREDIAQLDNPFDRIIIFENSGQVAEFNKKCVDFISQHSVCEVGTLDSLIWCLGEVMDNVLTHSEEPKGYVLAQFHQVSNRIAICVADAGIGILNSLMRGKYKPQDATEAIKLALKQGVGEGTGQGNGLYGLARISLANHGTLAISSGPSMIIFDSEGKQDVHDKRPYISKQNPGTIVDFQLNLNNPVDISKEFSTIGGNNIVDFRIDDMIQSDDTLLYNVLDNCSGTLTRELSRGELRAEKTAG